MWNTEKSNCCSHLLKLTRFSVKCYEMYFVNLLKLIPFAADVINTALSQYTADRINSFDHHWSKTKKNFKIVKINH